MRTPDMIARMRPTILWERTRGGKERRKEGGGETGMSSLPSASLLSFPLALSFEDSLETSRLS